MPINGEFETSLEAGGGAEALMEDGERREQQEKRKSLTGEHNVISYV